MNKQEAIKLLICEKVCVEDVDGNIGGERVRQAYDMAIEALQFQDIMANNPKTAKPIPEVCKNCKENKQDDWIPVSERGLPTKDEVDKDNRFLVTQSNSSVGVYVFNYDGTSEEYWKRNVVAWQPLPEPYKDGDTE